MEGREEERGREGGKERGKDGGREEGEGREWKVWGGKERANSSPKCRKTSECAAQRSRHTHTL